MDLITDLGSGLLAFIRGLPSPVWTLFGGGLGVAGTMWVERWKRNSDEEKEEREYWRARESSLQARRRENYVAVISLARDLRDNTSYERAMISQIPTRSVKPHIDAIRDINSKLENLNTAILRASIESSDDMRNRLKALRTVANKENIALMPGGPETAQQQSLRKEFGEAIAALDKAVHELFAPELQYPAPTPDKE